MPKTHTITDENTASLSDWMRCYGSTICGNPTAWLYRLPAYERASDDERAQHPALFWQSVDTSTAFQSNIRHQLSAQANK